MLRKKQISRDKRKPELKIFSFYSSVAKELGVSSSDVDAVYSDYLQQIAKSLPEANMLAMPNFGNFEVVSKKLRVTFFVRVIHMCDLLLEEEIMNRARKVEKDLSVCQKVLQKMVKDFEKCVICNVAEHTKYMCVRNVVGNIYKNVDRISHLKDELSQKVVHTLKEMYDNYAPRIIRHAEELGSVEFMHQYKEYVLRMRPELAEIWGMKKEKLDHTNFLSLLELEELYIPQYDIRYYL
jgi:hypothetical protein